ncbi:MAG: 4Fe-4S binding protein [Deltaproteobacteria bacterium]|nr:4Fe-4S binding protein [Deltaproteobacteria bacterium]
MANIEPIYQEIAGKITKDKNKALPRVLKMIANLEQANILRELPNTVEAIAEKLAMDEKTISKELQYLYERGLVNPSKKGWNLVNHIVLVKDQVASASHKYDDNDLFDLLHEMSLEDSDNLEERVKAGEKIPVYKVMRVVPKWKSVKDIPGILPIEDEREIFKNAPIVVHNCPCRVVYRDRDCLGTAPIDICLAAGSIGRRFLERGAGKELTYDEVMALLDKINEFPLVSTTGNSNNMPSILCSCCSDCCGLFLKAARTKPVLGKVPYAKSRFIVEDHPEECTACGICADDRCPVGAITMKDSPEFGECSYTDVEECIGCGLCVLTCPAEARKMKLVRPPDYIPEPASMFDDKD